MTEEIITEKYFDNKDDDFQDFTYYTVREGMHIHLYDAIKKQNEYVQRLKKKCFALTQESQQKSQTICELEQENRELKAYKDVNEDFKKAWDELNKKYTEVLKLAKENADSNEYCLQELEKENRELKKQIESQKGLITVGGKQQYDMTMAYDKCKTALEEIRNYCDRIEQGTVIGTQDCLINSIKNITNEVLNESK